MQSLTKRMTEQPNAMKKIFSTIVAERILQALAQLICTDNTHVVHLRSPISHWSSSECQHLPPQRNPFRQSAACFSSGVSKKSARPWIGNDDNAAWRAAACACKADAPATACDSLSEWRNRGFAITTLTGILSKFDRCIFIKNVTLWRGSTFNDFIYSFYWYLVFGFCETIPTSSGDWGHSIFPSPQAEGYYE